MASESRLATTCRCLLEGPWWLHVSVEELSSTGDKLKASGDEFKPSVEDYRITGDEYPASADSLPSTGDGQGVRLHKHKCSADKLAFTVEISKNALGIFKSYVEKLWTTVRCHGTNLHRL